MEASEAETERETRQTEIQLRDRRIFCPPNGDFVYAGTWGGLTSNTVGILFYCTRLETPELAFHLGHLFFKDIIMSLPKWKQMVLIWLDQITTTPSTAPKP